MRKIIIGILAAALISGFFMPVQADDNQNLEIFLNNNATASILLNDTIWNPTCGIGGSESSGDTEFNLDNNGTVQVDVTVSGAINMSWTLEGAPTHDVVELLVQPFGQANITVDEVATSFANNLAHDADVDFGVHLFMPTSTSTSAAAKITVTFTATAD